MSLFPAHPRSFYDEDSATWVAVDDETSEIGFGASQEEALSDLRLELDELYERLIEFDRDHRLGHHLARTLAILQARLA